MGVGVGNCLCKFEATTVDETSGDMADAGKGEGQKLHPDPTCSATVNPDCFGPKPRFHVQFLRLLLTSSPRLLMLFSLPGEQNQPKVKRKSPSFSMELTTTSPFFNQTCLSLG